MECKMIMPHFLHKSKKQFCTTEANETRRCTIVRNVVEITNRRLKTWKHLGQRIDNKCIPTLMENWRFVAAMNNCFFTPYLPYSDDPNVADRLLLRVGKEKSFRSSSQTMD